MEIPSGNESRAGGAAPRAHAAGRAGAAAPLPARLLRRARAPARGAARARGGAPGPRAVRPGARPHACARYAPRPRPRGLHRHVAQHARAQDLRPGPPVARASARCTACSIGWATIAWRWSPSPATCARSRRSTHDRATLSTLLESVAPDDNRVGGTDLAGALERALELFDGRTGDHEAIVRADRRRGPRGPRPGASRGRGRERGIRVYVVGMGTPDGGKIPGARPRRRRGVPDRPRGQGGRLGPRRRHALRAIAEASRRRLPVGATQSAFAARGALRGAHRAARGSRVRGRRASACPTTASSGRWCRRGLHAGRGRSARAAPSRRRKRP